MRFWRFTRGFFLGEIREFEVFFWSIIFPLILYFFLSAVLGGEGKGNSISFNLGVVGSTSQSVYGEATQQTLSAISGSAGPFVKTVYQDEQTAITDLKKGKLDVILILPKTPDSTQPGRIPLQVRYISGKESSKVAANILNIAFDRANLEIGKLSQPNYVSIASKLIPVTAVAKRTIAYKDYIFPSVALMMILSVALFNSPLGLIYYRVSGTNKKLFTTPLRPFEYFGAHLAKLMLTMLVSLTLLYLMAYFFYDVSGSILNAKFILSLLYAMLVLVSFGLMLASFARKESTATVLGQSFYQIMMFLGGFYFPVFGLPWAIRWFVYFIPSTYLVELCRRSMGFSAAPISLLWLIAVPALWLVFSVSVFSLNFRKVMGYE